MKKIGALFKLRFLIGLQYRTAAFAGIITQFAWGSLSILLYHAFYQTNPEAFPMSFSQLSSYIWLQQGFLTLFMIWSMENELFDLIHQGSIAYELVRPMDLYDFWFIRSMAVRLANTVLRCFPLFLIASVLPFPYSLVLPTAPLPLLIFLLSLLLAWINVVAFCMLIYISAFYTLSAMGIRMIAVTMVEFLSGALIPLPFLPDSIRFLIEWLPFASMQNAPLRIVIGEILQTEWLNILGLQLFWAVILILLGKKMMKKALDRIVIQGG